MTKKEELKKGDKVLCKLKNYEPFDSKILAITDTMVEIRRYRFFGGTYGYWTEKHRVEKIY